MQQRALRFGQSNIEMVPIAGDMSHLFTLNAALLEGSRPYSSLHSTTLLRSTGAIAPRRIFSSSFRLFIVVFTHHVH